MLSEAPVRYADGVVELDTIDLMSSGFGAPWGQSRSWTNGPGYSSGADNGNGVVDINQPYLVEVNGDDSTISVVMSGTNALYFDRDPTSGDYVERFDGHETLSEDATTGEFTLYDTAGDRLQFFSFDTSLLAVQRGQFESLADPYGNLTVLTYGANGRLAEVDRSNAAATPVTESFVYNYVASGVNQGLLSEVTQRQKTGSGPWATVRSVVYAYFDGTDSHGNAGDLKSATTEDPSNNVIDVDYYRYYRDGDANGYETIRERSERLLLKGDCIEIVYSSA
jgi:hypothetical protein